MSTQFWRHFRPGTPLCVLGRHKCGLHARPGGGDFHIAGDCSVEHARIQCTLGKLRCGTERALDLKFVISWQGEHNLFRRSTVSLDAVAEMCGCPCKLLITEVPPELSQEFANSTTRHCGGVCQQCWGCHQHCATHVFVTRFPFH